MKSFLSSCTISKLLMIIIRRISGPQKPSNIIPTRYFKKIYKNKNLLSHILKLKLKKTPIHKHNHKTNPNHKTQPQPQIIKKNISIHIKNLYKHININPIAPKVKIVKHLTSHQYHLIQLYLYFIQLIHILEQGLLFQFQVEQDLVLLSCSCIIILPVFMVFMVFMVNWV